jgi:AcrR family transcriptional regulator
VSKEGTNGENTTTKQILSSAGHNERRDAAEHRQRILATARTLFAKEGVDQVSMHQIAQAAGVGQGTLYRKFAHKGLLCLALLAENTERAQREFEEYLDTTNDPPLTRLLVLLKAIIRFNEENAQLLAAMLDAATGQRRTSAYHNPFYRWLRQRVVTLLEEAIEQKELGLLDVEYSADAILAPCAIDLYLYQRYELHFTPQRIVSGLEYLIFQGLRLSN